MKAKFSDPGLNMASYDFMSFDLKVNSNRDGEQATNWKTRLELRSNKRVRVNAFQILNRVEPGEWKNYLYPVSELQYQMNISDEDMKKIYSIIIFITESHYQHNDLLNFDFANFALIRLKNPVLHEMKLTPAAENFSPHVTWQTAILGKTDGNGIVRVSVMTPHGKICYQDETTVKKRNVTGKIPLAALNNAGSKFTVKLELVSGKKVLSSVQKPHCCPVKISEQERTEKFLLDG